MQVEEGEEQIQEERGELAQERVVSVRGHGLPADVQEDGGGEKKRNLMDWVQYLFQQAVSNEKRHHQDGKNEARRAIDYETKRRSNFLHRYYDMLVNLKNFDGAEGKKFLNALMNPHFKYFRPIFKEWRNGKRVLKARCEPCYEYYASRDAQSSSYGISQKGGTDFTLKIQC
ncbi:unnamed protein product [Strongylus vulgaris]|uniref:Uncharacterized protein n=1 Tax=Strongylus vulgaris TaxID=40348 RepID=A0A3P7J7L7_STRVU|nr:unnamed protein product [Strongylus vulgaris]